MEPLVSVLMPTKDRSTLIVRAIESVLTQTHKNVEIIVTDNSEGEETSLAVARFSSTRIKYSKNAQNIGPIRNWRRSLDLATGKYCILLPDDDYLLNPFMIEDTVRIAEEESVDLVLVNCVLGFGTGPKVGDAGISGRVAGARFLEGFWKDYSVPTIVNLFNREVALGLSPFLNERVLYSDIELWIKFMLRGDLYCYNIPSVYYRFHDTNIVATMTTNQLADNSAFLSVETLRGITVTKARVLAGRYFVFLSRLGYPCGVDLFDRVCKASGLKISRFYLFFAWLERRARKLSRLLRRWI